jgi:hypothetical protein
MADFHFIPAAQHLYVEGSADEGGIGEFRGTVLAIGVRGTDPVIPAEPNGHDPSAEGLLGWGSTHLLVADESRPAPIWVPKNSVIHHRVGTGGKTGAEVGD